MTDRLTDGQTDDVHSYNPLNTPWLGINKHIEVSYIQH